MEINYDKALSSVLSVLNKRLYEPLVEACADLRVEEIRFRAGRYPQIVLSDSDMIVSTVVFTREDSEELLEKLCGCSVYSHEEELKNGFISFEKGVRVGVCGRPVVSDGRIERLVDATSFNIRIPHEVHGCAGDIISCFYDRGRPVSVLIVSPPSVGKTTLLRDVVRCISDGDVVKPYKVGLVDERGEIAACVNGAPYYNVGCRTDVYEMIPKALAIPMMIRSMSPDLIVTDEIGEEADSAALSEAVRCGVSVIASAHASSKEDLYGRKDLKSVIDSGVFKRVYLLRRHNGEFRLQPIKT